MGDAKLIECEHNQGCPHRENPSFDPEEDLAREQNPHYYGLPMNPVSEEPKKECKGKAAARALAVIILDLRSHLWLEINEPKALEQAKKALEPFGYPDTDVLRKKLGL